MLAQAARIVLALTAFTAVFLIATPGRASAHADLVGTAPGNGEHLDAAPAQVRLRFTERVHLVTDAVVLLDGAATRVDTPPARLDGAVDVVLDVPAGLGDGIYTVVWRVVSADSHPVHGTFVFSVGTAVAPPVADGAARAGADPTLGAVFWIFRLLGYAALALFAGGLLFVTLCWPAGWYSPRVWALLLAGWGASLACAAAALLLQGPYAAGRTIAGLTDLALLRSTVATEYGRYVIARLALLFAAGGLLLLSRRVTGPALVGVRGAVIGLAVVAVPATWPGTGHANVGGLLPLVVTTLHMIAMVSWLGGLVLLLSCVLPGPADESPTGMGRTLARFSRLAMICVGVLVATGIYQAWQGLGGLAALAGSSYGGLLAFKLAILGVLLTFAAFSRSMVRRYYLPVAASTSGAEVRDARTPAVVGAGRAGSGGRTSPARSPSRTRSPGRTGSPGRTARRNQRAEHVRLAHLRRRLRRAVGIESGIAVVILALTSVLVATPPGRPAVAPVRLDVAAETGPASTFTLDRPLTTGGSVHVVIDPPRRGMSRFTVEVTDAAGNALDVPEVRAVMSLVEGDAGPLPIALTHDAPGRYSASALTIPFAGLWELRVTVRTTDFDQTTIVAQVTVS